MNTEPDEFDEFFDWVVEVYSGASPQPKNTSSHNLKVGLKNNQILLVTDGKTSTKVTKHESRKSN